MNNRSWGYQIQLALLVGIVAAALILIASLLRGEGRRPFSYTGVSNKPAYELPGDIILHESSRRRSSLQLLRSTPNKPLVEQTLDIGRTQTIEDITIELIKARVIDDIGLRLVYSVETSDRDAITQGIGEPNIKFSDGHISLKDGKGWVDDYKSIIFSDESRLPVAGESVTISMGSYIILAPDLSGSVNMPLGLEYPDLDEGQEVTAETYLEIGEAQFGASIVKLEKLRTQINVVPINEPAQRIVLTFSKSTGTSVFLTDDRNSILSFAGKESNRENDIDSPLFKSQSFVFEGLVAPDTTSFTFGIEGGWRIRGPFIFEDVRLVPK